MYVRGTYESLKTFPSLWMPCTNRRAQHGERCCASWRIFAGFRHDAAYNMMSLRVRAALAHLRTVCSLGELAQASFCSTRLILRVCCSARAVPPWSSPEKKHGVMRLLCAVRCDEGLSVTAVSAFLPTSSLSSAQKYSSCAAQLFDAWPRLSIGGKGGSFVAVRRDRPF